MNDQNPQTTPPVPQAPPAPPVPPTPAPKVEKPTTKDKSYAAYDTDYLRFVAGGVHDTKAKAKKAAEDAGSEHFEIREV